MRKINKLNIFNLILFIIVLGLCVSQFVFEIFNVNTKEFCVLVLLFGVGLSLLTKGIIFKSSNSVWFALIIFSYGLFLLLSIYFGELRNFYGSAFLIMPALLGFIIYIIYKEIIYLKISLYLIFISIPILLYNLKVISIVLFLILLVFAVLVTLFIQIYVKNKK